MVRISRVLGRRREFRLVYLRAREEIETVRGRSYGAELTREGVLLIPLSDSIIKATESLEAIEQLSVPELSNLFTPEK